MEIRVEMKKINNDTKSRIFDYCGHNVWKLLKCRICIFQLGHFPSIFVLLKLTCLVTLFDRKLQFFKNSPKLTYFGIFNELLSTQNVNVAHFARKVEWDFFCNFQTLCILSRIWSEGDWYDFKVSKWSREPILHAKIRLWMRCRGSLVRLGCKVANAWSVD